MCCVCTALSFRDGAYFFAGFSVFSGSKKLLALQFLKAKSVLAPTFSNFKVNTFLNKNQIISLQPMDS